MTGTNCDLFTHNQSRSYLNHLVFKTERFPFLAEGKDHHHNHADPCHQSYSVHESNINFNTFLPFASWSPSWIFSSSPCNGNYVRIFTPCELHFILLYFNYFIAFILLSVLALLQKSLMRNSFLCFYVSWSRNYFSHHYFPQTQDL